MSSIRPTIARAGWRNWLNEHRSPQGWGADEFDVLAWADTPVSVFVRIWKRDRRTIQKYLDARKNEQTS